jgi:hypothetical protein
MWSVRSVTDFETNLVSVERINEYVELPSEVKEVSRPAKADFSVSDH